METIDQSSQLFCVLVSYGADVFYLFPPELRRPTRAVLFCFSAVIQAGAQGQSTGTRRDSLSSFSPPDLPQHFKSLQSRPCVALAEDICSPVRAATSVCEPSACSRKNPCPFTSFVSLDYRELVSALERPLPLKWPSLIETCHCIAIVNYGEKPL